MKEVSVDGGITWDDSDSPPGPTLVKSVTAPMFRYTVTNDGEMDLSNVIINDDTDLNLIGPSGDDGDNILQTTETWEYIAAENWAAGQQTNTAIVQADFTNGNGTTGNVQDADDANYFGASPAIMVVKEVSVDDGITWDDANIPPGPRLVEGNADPMFRYKLTNEGNVDLSNVAVSDDTGLTLIGPSGDDGDNVLQTTEIWVYTADDIWKFGQRTNIATADAEFSDDGGIIAVVQDTDPANYFGAYPSIEVVNFWVSNGTGYERSFFRPGDEIQYITVIENTYNEPFSVDLRLEQVGPCVTTQIFAETLMVDPGLKVDIHQTTASECLGTYKNTVELTFDGKTSTQVKNFDVVTYSSEIVVSDKQGFDKCGLPTVEQMQTWWKESPYWVFNIYLGGSSFACNNPELNIDWVWEVSQQGWEYILTWVGPQSPCFDTVKPKISPNVSVAYQQGIDQANLAIAAAENLGLVGDKIIYYDIEGYEDNQTCRKAVDSFLTGWTAHLHQRGFKAGAYGSPCRSFMGDWWDNDPLLDDIWFARWIYPYQFRPEVSLFGDACTLTDSMWADNQRLRQYAGDHNEVWGGVSLGSIDSNILGGEITAITTTTNINVELKTADLSNSWSAGVDDMGLLSSTNGWVLQGNQLLMTRNDGDTWQVISPENIGQILAVEFFDPDHGWLVSLDDRGDLWIHQTKDAGKYWQIDVLPFTSMDVSTVFLEFADAQTGWLVQKLVSSSSFSLGKLFATQDGGRTWEARSIPLGEPVHFSDALNGWVVGGPAEDQFYRTEDGGKSWLQEGQAAYLAAIERAQPASLTGTLQDNTAQISVVDASNAWRLTQNGACSGEKNATLPDAQPLQCWQSTRLWTTQDGGQTWQDITP
jgi:photosystem II stability/assembly factor-like uncharacterized protein